MIETIGLILFLLAILFVAIAAPKPAGKKAKEKEPVPQQPMIAADKTNNGALSQPPKPADHSASPPQSPDNPG
jgi:hypothetical protein